MNFWIEIVMSNTEVVAGWEESPSGVKTTSLMSKGGKKVIKLCSSERVLSGAWVKLCSLIELMSKLTVSGR